MLSILTYNIRYGEKLHDIIQWLIQRNTAFDIICFQEFPIAKIDTFLSSIEVTNYDYRFSNGFKKRNKQYGQLTLFKRKDIKILDDTVLSLGSSVLERSKTKGERSSLLTRFSYKDKQFLLANTHLVCFALNKKRLVQLEKIIKHFASVADSKLPILVVGDFNYSSLIRQKKLLDYMEGHGFINAYKTHTFKLLFLKYQLDYVFYKNCEINNVDVLKLNFSDHFPAEFQLDLHISAN
ncbi:MAG TPA: endonuclease/exonuclease/phosphatase family protein [Candidatus Saccharimonadales bacterium]|nr:endonuclease/exonuclease/phosphatase family protein [Candidatus Saccharimonadales bacterium]